MDGATLKERWKGAMFWRVCIMMQNRSRRSFRGEREREQKMSLILISFYNLKCVCAVAWHIHQTIWLLTFFYFNDSSAHALWNSSGNSAQWTRRVGSRANAKPRPLYTRPANNWPISARLRTLPITAASLQYGLMLTPVPKVRFCVSACHKAVCIDYLRSYIIIPLIGLDRA